MRIGTRHSIAVAVAVVFGGAIAAEPAPSIDVSGVVSPSDIGLLNNNVNVQLVVGSTADGVVSVLNGATFSGPSFVLGRDAAVTGTMTVGGAGA